MNTKLNFEAITVTRTTNETEFALSVQPRTMSAPSLPLPNRLLSHLLDHFSKAAGISLELLKCEWPGSWTFDHVLCEDLGQLTGRAVLDIIEQRAAKTGVPGRATALCCMDDAAAEVAISFENRPHADWTIPEPADINGFVDAWYDESGIQAWAAGTNLRQFIDGFTFGSGATVHVTVRQPGNLHHLYECIFRALGDAVRIARGAADEGRLPGDGSGLAAKIEYTVRRSGGKSVK